MGVAEVDMARGWLCLALLCAIQTAASVVIFDEIHKTFIRHVYSRRRSFSNSIFRQGADHRSLTEICPPEIKRLINVQIGLDDMRHAMTVS